MKRDVFKIDSGVKINFTQGSNKQNIVTMVENCSTGKCECMSEETKRKIDTIHVTGEDGNVDINISGTISKDEIEQALAKSKVINQKCC